MSIAYFYLGSRGCYRKCENGSVVKLTVDNCEETQPEEGIPVVYFYLNRGKLYRKEENGSTNMVAHENLPNNEIEVVNEFFLKEIYKPNDEDNVKRLSLKFGVCEKLLKEKGGYTQEDILKMTYDFVLYKAEKINQTA